MLPYVTESFGKSVSGSSLCVPVPGNSGKNRHTRLLNRIAFKPRCFQPDILAGFYCTVVTGKEWLSMFFAFYNIIKNPKWSTNDIIPKLDKKGYYTYSFSRSIHMLHHTVSRGIKLKEPRSIPTAVATDMSNTLHLYKWRN